MRKQCQIALKICGDLCLYVYESETYSSGGGYIAGSIYVYVFLLCLRDFFFRSSSISLAISFHKSVRILFNPDVTRFLRVSPSSSSLLGRVSLVTLVCTGDVRTDAAPTAYCSTLNWFLFEYVMQSVGFISSDSLFIFISIQLTFNSIQFTFNPTNTHTHIQLTRTLTLTFNSSFHIQPN